MSVVICRRCPFKMQMVRVVVAFKLYFPNRQNRVLLFSYSATQSSSSEAEVAWVLLSVESSTGGGWMVMLVTMTKMINDEWYDEANVIE